MGGRLQHFFFPSRAAYIAPCLSRRGSVLAQSRTRGQAASRRFYSTCIRPVGPPLLFPGRPSQFLQASRSGSVISRAVWPSAFFYSNSLASFLSVGRAAHRAFPICTAQDSSR